jgi:Flp pilus assembly protein TadG
MRRFWSDRRGNVALVFALAAIPVFGAMGAAVDYSMASAYRSDIQKALDATALALTKIMPAEQRADPGSS